jgi:hypothetical protein
LVHILCISITNINAQNTNSQIFSNILSSKLPSNKPERLVAIAKSFLGKPYQAGTLESPGPEKLVINLQGLDCSTLVENCLALTFTQNTNYDSYLNELTKLRYRQGKVDGYGSRLHYLSEWLANNAQKGYFEILKKENTTEILPLNVNFMSKHWQLYPSAATQDIKNEIVNSENTINNIKLHYIPKANVQQNIQHIKAGDIIAITTNKTGLDCAHQGIAVLQNGQIHLLHASSEKKKVIVSAETLVVYLNRIKSHSGIIVARLK